MRKRILTRLAAAAAGGTLALAVASPALAEVETVPDETNFAVYGPGQENGPLDIAESDGDPECDDQKKIETGGEGPWTEHGFKVTEDTGSDGPSYTVEVVDEGLETSKLHLKTGREYTSYVFDDPVTEASGLTGINPGGQIAALSHIWICFDPDGEPAPPSPTADPTASPSGPPEETQPPEETSSPSPSDEPGQGGEEGDDEGLPVTGVGLGGLLLLAGGLIAGGVALLAVKRRRDMSELLEG